jgi:hypothetical protein
MISSTQLLRTIMGSAELVETFRSLLHCRRVCAGDGSRQNDIISSVCCSKKGLIPANLRSHGKVLKKKSKGTLQATDEADDRDLWSDVVLTSVWCKSYSTSIQQDDPVASSRHITFFFLRLEFPFRRDGNEEKRIGPFKRQFQTNLFFKIRNQGAAAVIKTT